MLVVMKLIHSFLEKTTIPSGFTTILLNLIIRVLLKTLLPTVCDFTDLLDYLRAPCHVEGGVLYSITLDQFCAEDNSEYHDTNIPICLAPSCNVDDEIYSDTFNFCSSPSLSDSLEIHINEVEPLISDVCIAETQLFTDEAGYGDPHYIFEHFSEQYCTTESYDSVDVEICDFEPVIEMFQGPCEEQGGRLYKLSDSVSIYHDDSSTTEQGFWLNSPICIGISCDIDNYYENFMLPYFHFELDGDFPDFSADYEPIEFVAVSDVSTKKKKPKKKPKKPKKVKKNKKTKHPKRF
mmetsp:Transcript_14276/g.17335  ORF Transcript_14276/g.17335 Transcript_14276/m.17335 type:complete len:293 (+) Transcript_14276:445-1323(+)